MAVSGQKLKFNEVKGDWENGFFFSLRWPMWYTRAA